MSQAPTKTRRRADRVIWAGLRRLPAEGEAPTIVIEFMSKGRLNREPDLRDAAAPRL
jgi:hypothetical protein